MTSEDREELKILIRTALHDGCLCGHGAHVNYFFQRIQTLGEGNTDKGIESFSKTIMLLTKVRRGGEKIGGAVAVALAVSGASGLVWLIWQGVEVVIKSIKAGP